MDKVALLDEIIQYTTPPRLEEDEFTLRDFMDRCAEQGNRLSYNVARGRLDKMVQDGQLESRKVLHGGKWTTAYRKPEIAI